MCMICTGGVAVARPDFHVFDVSTCVGFVQDDLRLQCLISTKLMSICVGFGQEELLLQCRIPTKLRSVCV